MCFSIVRPLNRYWKTSAAIHICSVGGQEKRHGHTDDFHSDKTHFLGGDRVEYQSQVERNIETLKRDLPTLFEQDISYDIYTQDIYFQDPVNKFQTKFNYRIIFWTLRFHARLFFTKIYFDLHDVYQSAEDIILAKWTVRGVLRVPWKAGIFFNGYSTYKLNKNGLIYEHIDTWDRKPGEILQQFFRKGGES